MTLEIQTFVLGPLENNSYLIADSETHLAVVIDPSFDSEQILESARQNGYTLEAIWLTHAHFDHMAGNAALAGAFQPPLPVGLHPQDFDWWENAGGASLFGFHIQPGPHPSISFADRQTLLLGKSEFTVLHTPGHSKGHVVFYAQSDSVAFVGDLIFKNGVGRTDLPGGDQDALLASIYRSILTLPLETRLLPGHGPETTVSDEVEYNPYLN
jgi:glyoxylase-like metal-dependent hydrolase (beta-lactamase superfamily II)